MKNNNRLILKKIFQISVTTLYYENNCQITQMQIHSEHLWLQCSRQDFLQMMTNNQPTTVRSLLGKMAMLCEVG